MKATVFLGGGRITAALIAGLRLAGYSRPIVVHDRNPEKSRALRREFRVEVAHDLKSAIEQAEILVVAVRPNSVAELLGEVAGCDTGSRPRIAVSLAAGIPLKKLRAALGPPIRWARAMPSPVCRVACGLTALTFDDTVSSAERKRIRRLFEYVGTAREIPENQFDAFTATFSSSHGYHALATLAQAAQEVGLDRKTAFACAAHALADGISYWRESGQDLQDLLQEAATPGGTAAATMQAEDKAGYVKAVKRGLRAGIGQARDNARR